LANAACRQGFSARYYRSSRLLQELSLAKGDGSYPRLLSQLAKIELLVLDDWGLAPFTDTNSRDLLEVIDDRCQVRSTIVVSQLPVEHWHGLFPDPTVADAVLDRLVHNAYKINLRGESMRKIK
jgi:DNA replication protein DnaC